MLQALASIWCVCLCACPPQACAVMVSLLGEAWLLCLPTRDSVAAAASHQQDPPDLLLTVLTETLSVSLQRVGSAPCCILCLFLAAMLLPSHKAHLLPHAPRQRGPAVNCPTMADTLLLICRQVETELLLHDALHPERPVAANSMRCAAAGIGADALSGGIGPQPSEALLQELAHRCVMACTPTPLACSMLQLARRQH